MSIVSIDTTVPTPTVKDDGFTILASPADAIADIVFIHGLQGGPRETWTCDSLLLAAPGQGSRPRSKSSDRIRKVFRLGQKEQIKTAQTFSSNDVFWPLDLLPIDCNNARILTWGYDSKVTKFFGGAVNQSNIVDHARNLLHALKRERQQCQGRGIIFVAHSLGGIVVKDAIRRAAGDMQPAEIQDIYSSTKAILFLGTPHRGSSKADVGETLRRIASAVGLDTSAQNLIALDINSGQLLMIQEEFMNLYGRTNRHFEVSTFQEGQGLAGTKFFGLNARIVEPFSSRLTDTEMPQTINANHNKMCKYSNRDDEGYKQVLGELQMYLAKIQSRRREAALAFAAASEPIPASTVQSPDASSVYSMNEIERKCVANLMQNTADAESYMLTLPSRVEGTCQWILHETLYTEWTLEKSTCLLWISGYPGSGKTILSTYLLDNFREGTFPPRSRTTLCFFFCDEKSETQRDGTAILRSIIHQLIKRQRSLIKYVKRAYDLHGPRFDQNFNELWRTFIDIASESGAGPITIIVDAIDECDEATGGRFMQEITKLEERCRAAGTTCPCIKFLVTSRPVPGEPYTARNLQLDDPESGHLDKDLQLFIRTKVDGIAKRTSCKQEVKDYLEDALYTKADRTFLWVNLVLILVERSFHATKTDYVKIIDRIPPDLVTTYQRFLSEIPIEGQALATKFLHLVVGSSRPLTLGELRILIAIQDHHRSLADVEEDAEPNIQRTLEGVLLHLVRIRESRVYLVHQSLKDFLLDLSTKPEDPQFSAYGVDPQKANSLLAELCVSYLLLQDFQKDIFASDQFDSIDSPLSPVSTPSEELFNPLWTGYELGKFELFKDPEVSEAEACASIAARYQLFDYAARHWPHHFRAASTSSLIGVQNQALVLSDCSKTQGMNWLRYYWHHAESELSLPLHFDPTTTAGYFGHITTLKTAHLDSESGSIAIFWASRNGHLDVVDHLLQKNFSPDKEVLPGSTAFMAAVEAGHLVVVNRFLAEDGRLPGSEEYRVNHAITGGRTPLFVAAGSGFVHICREILRNPVIQPDLQDSKHCTPLFRAVGGDYLDVVQLLLIDGRMSVNHLDRNGRNALSWAAASGYLDIVKYLVSIPDLRVDEPDQTGRTPFIWATDNGQLETVMFLRRSCARRIDISRKDNGGRNAISLACEKNQLHLVKYLMKHDRQGVDEPDDEGWTPLSWSLFNNAPAVTQVILDSGLVNVNKKDRAGRSPLSFAAEYGYPDIVKSLLNVPGIEVDSTNDRGLTPLSYASFSAAFGCKDVIKILEEARKKDLE